MLLSGKKKTSLLIFLVLILSSIHAEDAGQYLGDQKKDFSEIEAIESGESAFVPGASKDLEKEITEFKNDDEEADSFHVPGRKAEKAEIKSSIGGFGVTMPFNKRENYLETNNRDIFKNIYRKGTWALSFSYISDDYEITDSRGIYRKTFEQSSGANRYGGVQLGMDRYFYRGFFDFSYGFNLGMGMSKGKGSFSTSQSESDTTFTLWSLPLDFSLTMELPLGRFLNLAVSGGPSAMGLYQNRDDKESGEKYKYRRQVSPGYFATAKLKISLGNIFSSSMFNLFSDYKITNYYLNVMMRHQTYENFQDEISISGSSIGAGFTFDYL
jgi:hypothetical protein